MKKKMRRKERTTDRAAWCAETDSVSEWRRSRRAPERNRRPRRAAGFVDAMRDALRAYLRFAGVNRFEWATHLGTEKRLFLTRP